jgi:hypothetical protein
MAFYTHIFNKHQIYVFDPDHSHTFLGPPQRNDLKTKSVFAEHLSKLQDELEDAVNEREAKEIQIEYDLKKLNRLTYQWKQTTSDIVRLCTGAKEESQNRAEMFELLKAGQDGRNQLPEGMTKEIGDRVLNFIVEKKFLPKLVLVDTNFLMRNIEGVPLDGGVIVVILSVIEAELQNLYQSVTNSKRAAKALDFIEDHRKHFCFITCHQPGDPFYADPRLLEYGIHLNVTFRLPVQLLTYDVVLKVRFALLKIGNNTA